MPEKILMHDKITGDRIFLHRYEISFTEKLFKAGFESRGGDFTRWMPWCGENYQISESESFIKSSIENWEKETEFNFAIFDTHDGDFIGGISLNQFNPHHNLVNLGYWIRMSCQNRGCASAATRLLAEASFADLPINRIEILAAIENEASQRVAEKAGATREGVLRKRLLIGGRVHDAEMFSFVREDFEK